MSVIKFSKDKRAISIMIGYILLITSAVVMSSIVYQWMKSYVPKDTIDCPDGVSLFVTESNCTLKSANNYEVIINLRNNGRFDVGGYFIHATDSLNQTLATVDLSKNFMWGGQVSNNAVVFIEKTQEVSNYLKPNANIDGVFNSTKKLYSLEIIPIRYQVLDNKKQLVSCGDAKIIENINCDPIICGDGKVSSGEQCDDANTANSDGCDSNCQIEIVCADTCTSLGYNCDSVCGVSCGVCNTGYKCEAGSCVVNLCGNSVVDTGEECDSVAGCGEDCLHLSGYNCNPAFNICATL